MWAPIHLVPSSGDVAASGTPSNFHVRFPAILLPGGPAAWSIRVANISFPRPAADGNSIFVYLPNTVSDNESRVGSAGTVGFVFRIRPMSSTEPSPVYLQSLDPRPAFFPLKTSILQDMTIVVEESNGTGVPSTNPDGSAGFTTLQMELVRNH